MMPVFQVGYFSARANVMIELNSSANVINAITII